MKKTTILLFVFSAIFAYSQSNEQNKIIIDTVEFHFKLKDIADITSFVPQIKSGVNSVTQKIINEDLRTYFQASSIKQDSVAYVKELFEYFHVENLEEYFEKQEDYKLDNPYYKVRNPNYFGDELEEDFKIEYLSENLLNITIDSQILPYGGQYQFFFESVRYDLRTGNKLDFNDFFSISKEVLNQNLQENGYWFIWNNETLKMDKKPFGLYDVEYIIDDLDFGKNTCNGFYFSTFEDEIYLMIKLKCMTTYIMDYGIPLEKLKTHIEYFEFKNLFQLWGENPFSLIGQDYAKLGNKVEFKNYFIKHIGGYLLPKDNFETVFGISEYWSFEKRFLLFYKFIDSKQIITDILEIDKKDLKSRKLTEYCSTKNGLDSEIIAIVKASDSEYYTEIIKAWKANRKNGKFEKINRKEVKKCRNENYGI